MTESSLRVMRRFFFCAIISVGKSQVSQMAFKEKNISIDEYLCLSDFLVKNLARNKKADV